MQVNEFFSRLEKYRYSDAKITDDARQLSYGELLDAVDRLAQEFTTAGYQRLGLLADNSVDWLMLDLAALKAGITLVPLPLFFSAAQRESAIVDAQIDALALSTTHIQRLTHTALPHLAAKITYTSGSTGSPKGVCLTAEHLLTTVSALRQALPEQASNSHLAILPLAVLLENIAGSWLALSFGADLHLPSLKSLGYTASHQIHQPTFYEQLRSKRAQSLILTPALAELIVHGVESAQLDAAQFTFLAVGGAAVTPTLLERAEQAQVPLYEGYGLSECGSVVCLNTPRHKRNGSVGKVLSHQQVKVENGQLFTRGAYMLGYLHDQHQAAANDWHATGDLGRIDEDGFVYVAGRLSNLIITSFGRNISPEWLETLAQPFTEWQQFMVFGDGRARLGAIISPSSEATQEQIDSALTELNRQLPDYAHISGWLQTTEPFSEQNELLTHNKRLRRKAILKTYLQAIQQFYGD
jgi:long-subunit acyl-CoA synthetase (AMP-forming)